MTSAFVGHLDIAIFVTSTYFFIRKYFESSFRTKFDILNYPAMKWHISSWLFTKLNISFPFVFYTAKSDNKLSLQPYHNCYWNCYWNSYNCSNLIWTKHWRNCSFTFRLDFRWLHPGLDWGKYQFLINWLRAQNEEMNLKFLSWMWQSNMLLL